jgi:hypothetical protein
LWIQNDDVVGRSPAIIASVADEVIVDATHVLLAAMKGYMQATWLRGALGRHVQVSHVMETDTFVGSVGEFGLIERHQGSLLVRITGSGLQRFRIEMVQEHLGGLIPTLNHVRWFMLPTLPDWKAALPREDADRNAMIGRSPGLILVEQKLWLVNSEHFIELLEGVHDSEWDNVVALPMEQPYPAIRKVGWIVDQPAVRRLSQKPDRVLSRRS